MNDSFTIAVVVGIGVVLAVFLGLVLLDKGPPGRSRSE